MDSNIIKIGDKVDIRILQQVEQAKKTGERPLVYHSKVHDIPEEGSFEVIVPVEAGNHVSLPKGIRMEFMFFAEDDIYRCIAHIRQRYVKGNFAVYLADQKTPLEKYQRRDYYRFECVMNMQYLPITEAEAEMEDTKEIEEHHRLHYPQDLFKDALAVDISGGGIRFIGSNPGKKDKFLLMTFRLQNEAMDYLIEIVGDILKCQEMEGEQGEKKYEYRVNFLLKNQTEREMIIKYIFEQERRSREKE